MCCCSSSVERTGSWLQASIGLYLSLVVLRELDFDRKIWAFANSLLELFLTHSRPVLEFIVKTSKIVPFETKIRSKIYFLASKTGPIN